MAASRPIDVQKIEEDLIAAMHDIADLARDAVPGCDGASVSLLHDGRATSLAATEGRVRVLDQAQYGRGQGPCVTAMHERQAITVDDYRTDRRWPEVAAEAEDVGIRSSLSLPLGDDRSLGGLNMYGTRVGAFTAHSQQSAQTFARQAMLMLGYLQQLHSSQAAHAREHSVALTLQRSLLPNLPDIDGLTCAARYLASQSHTQVGGDWYDLFRLPDGAVGITIGDVMGHDVAAAAAMGQLRSVLRAYAFEGISPSVLLDRTDRLVQGFDLTPSATLVYGRLVLDDRAPMFLYSTAGHPPPLLRHPDGTVRQLDGGRSALIGVVAPDQLRRSDAAVSMPPGSLLLFYTDGLVENRDCPLEEGIESLIEALDGIDVSASPSTVCDLLLEQLIGPAHTDDVAILAVRVGGHDDNPH